MLEEARAARYFWRQFGALLPEQCKFTGRKPRTTDIANHLLDIGYHHLTGIVKKLLEQHEVSGAIGLLHSAHRVDSVPFAYDLVEIFRADIVDAEALRFLRLKKKSFKILAPNDIAHFLHEVNERLERRFYLKDFKRCHKYRYYMELQILKLIKAVNRKKLFEPLRLLSRHETRCDD